MPNPCPEIGMRVKLIRGTVKGPYRHRGENQEYYDYGMWCGGNVPVGSTGTVVRKRVFPENHPNNSTMLAIDFDGIKPKGDYFFGIGPEPLPDSFEVI